MNPTVTIDQKDWYGFLAMLSRFFCKQEDEEFLYLVRSPKDQNMDDVAVWVSLENTPLNSVQVGVKVYQEGTVWEVKIPGENIPGKTVDDIVNIAMGQVPLSVKRVMQQSEPKPLFERH